MFLKIISNKKIREIKIPKSKKRLSVQIRNASYQISQNRYILTVEAIQMIPELKRYLKIYHKLAGDLEAGGYMFFNKVVCPSLNFINNPEIRKVFRSYGITPIAGNEIKHGSELSDDEIIDLISKGILYLKIKDQKYKYKFVHIPHEVTIHIKDKSIHPGIPLWFRWNKLPD